MENLHDVADACLNGGLHGLLLGTLSPLVSHGVVDEPICSNGFVGR